MTEHVYLEEDEVVHRAVQAIVRDLGPVEAMRFLSLHRDRVIDSVAHHRQWQDDLDKDRFFDTVFGLSEQTGG